MKIKELLAALVSRFNIGDLVDKIRTMRKTIKEVDIPLWATASKELKTLKHPKAKKLEDVINHGCKGVYRGGLTQGIYDAVRNAQLVLDYLEDLISTEFNHSSQEILKDGLTFKKANILQYVDVIDFMMEYSRRVCELLYVLEAAEKNPSGQRIEDAFTPADLDYVDKNIEPFIEALRISSLSVKDLSKSFEEIPNAVATAESENVMTRTMGAQRIDPFGMRGFVTTRSPVYHFQMWYAERQIYRYQQALETKKLIELRLLKLREMKSDGEAPENIDRQIQYQETRLDKVNRSIRQKEEAYGATA